MSNRYYVAISNKLCGVVWCDWRERQLPESPASATPVAMGTGTAAGPRRREVREAGADTVKRACGLHGSGVGPRRGEPFEDVASKAVPKTAH